MTLEELSKAIPQEEFTDSRDDQEEAARLTRLEAQHKAEELKRSISAQLDTGNAPGNILLSAIQAIGLLSGDPAWTDAQERKLDTFYNAAVDSAVNAAQDATEKTAQYAEKIRNRIRRDLAQIQKLQTSLADALEKAEALYAQGMLEK